MVEEGDISATQGEDEATYFRDTHSASGVAIEHNEVVRGYRGTTKELYIVLGAARTKKTMQ